LGYAVLAACGCVPAGAYSPYYTDTFETHWTYYWKLNGQGTFGTKGFCSRYYDEGGTLVSLHAVWDGSSDYEVTMKFNPSVGKSAILLRASQDAQYGRTLEGTYYSVEYHQQSSWMQIGRYQGGVSTVLTGRSVALAAAGVHTLRAYIYGTEINGYIDGQWMLFANDAAIGQGKPGVATTSNHAGGCIAEVSLWPIDRTAPAAVSRSGVGTTAYPGRVEMQWAAPPDDPGGVNRMWYTIHRDGAWLTNVMDPIFTDETVAPSSTYNYEIYALDGHGNQALPVSFTVETPPAGTLDSRRTGVRPDGAYWGGMGEQIDMRSGNLNFSVPLFTAMGRNGLSVPVTLVYDSQMWRRDGAGDWLLARNTGAGLGWRVMAGALTPYWVDGWTVHHYKFTAASGAEYRLDRNSGGVWTSGESGVYLEYDANSRRLYYPDGTFWLMGAESSEAEADAGTLYPTVAEDPNGNEITFVYANGMYAASGNSSSRIKYVADVRAVPTDVCFSSSDVCNPFTGEGFVNLPATYVLSHTSESHYVEGVPVVTVQLRSIRNTIGTAESYGFQYAWQPVASPFSPYASYGTAVMLTGVGHSAIGESHTFSYVPAGGGPRAS
jgi:hypothetical protein